MWARTLFIAVSFTLAGWAMIAFNAQIDGMDLGA